METQFNYIGNQLQEVVEQDIIGPNLEFLFQPWPPVNW